MPGEPIGPEERAERERRQKLRDPLHGMTLQAILERLVAHYGFSGLAQRIRIHCFVSNPNIKSSLNFLRRTPWAREKVERLYLDMPGVRK